MSTDDPGSWFETSSNPDEGTADPQPERRLEAVPAARAPDESGWFDNDQKAIPPVMDVAHERPTRSTTSRNLGPKTLFAGSVIVALLVIGGGAWFVASLLEDTETVTATPLAVPTPEPTSELPSVPARTAACEVSESDKVTTGAGKGDQDSVAGVILAFQHAYYVERDADKVEPLLAEDSTIRDLAALQKGIDSVDRATKHCLHISDEGDGVAAVELTEIADDGSETVIKQRVTTNHKDGDVQIVSIEPVEDSK